MTYVSAVSGNSEGVEYVKHVIFESNPLLEAFGNAKTLRNNNSSRFGKYFEIVFNQYGDPSGGRITNYLLEKSRVVFQTPGERSFHIFYQLLAGASDDEAQRWQLYSPENFTYLSASGCYTVDGMNDSEEYGDVRKAMNTIGINAKEQSDCLQLVAGILHLGNLAFVEDGSGNAAVYDPQVLDLISAMLQVDTFTLQSAILFRVITTGGGPGAGRSSTYNVPQNVEQAGGARDALSKVIYSRMFDWLVSKVNDALQKTKTTVKAVIGVLDIFGFEIFGKNGFEQFCINFVNEKLQQFFIELTLKAEQEEYVREGIKWEPVKYFNNQIVCDLIEGKAPPGIFSILDDVCYTVHATSDGTDIKFLSKLGGSFPSHLHLRCLDTSFQVKHYAGEVTYDVDQFCEKNKDTLFNDLIEAMQTTQNGLLLHLFPDDTKTQSKKRPTTAGFKIKTSAGQLMTTLAACSPHYIRCIKPNETKKAFDWDLARVKHQVQYLGLLENVRVRRAGFAYRAEFSRFLQRYKKLSRKTWGIWGEWNGDPKEGCSVLLQDLGMDQKQWQLGKTKVFIRHPESLFFLEELLERRDYDCTVRIQRAWGNWKMQKIALQQRAAAADLMRGKKERQRDSVSRKFTGDYSNYKDNYAIQEAVARDETMVFADQVINLNRRGQPERRDFVITDRSFYFIMRKKADNKVVYEVARRSALSSIQEVSISSLQDNYLVIHCPSEYDMCFENEHKSEIVTLLVQNCKASTGRDIRVNFSDNITYKIKTKDTRNITFAKNESAGAKAQLKKTAKTMQVFIGSGLPKDTDTTPKNMGAGGKNFKITPRGAGAGARGGGGGGGGGHSGGGGGGGARQAAAPVEQPAAAAGPARGGAGAARGGARGGGPGAGAGGPRGGGPGAGAGAAQARPTSQAMGAGPGAGAGGPRGGGPGAGAGAARGGGPGAGAGAARGGGPGAGAGAARGGGPGAGAGAGAGAAQGGVRQSFGPGAVQAQRGGPGGPGAPRGGKAPPPAKPAQPQAKALYDYDAGTDDELTFREGDVLIIHQKDPGGWWEGELGGRRGWIPANYVQEI
eukprot:TRINITY_DN313_c0_g1_i3.p1 TRINITY_DN313_c0_g1~~TRINITY_DN313_c0_g1_i3.p1  ORF type:complete len:1065 (+),score=294.08 TRINITY_DN313_c0_g1_i3:655-3849(+)